jgi:pilus assembly protein CpaD
MIEDAQKMLATAGILIGLVALSGCSSPAEHMMAHDKSLIDHNTRHPILVDDRIHELEIIPAPALDLRARGQIAEFAMNHARFGKSPIAIIMPAQPAKDRRLPHQVNEIRNALQDAGVRGPVRVDVAPRVETLQAAATIKLVFVGLKAKVPTACGQWPDDLASGSSLTGWSNRPYWNHGCANQAMLAAQAADPRDFIRARAMSASDSEMRLRAIGQVRRGIDPATAWREDATAAGAGSGK